MLKLLSYVGKITLIILVAVTLKVGGKYLRGGYEVERPVSPELQEIVDSVKVNPIIETRNLGIQVPARSSEADRSRPKLERQGRERSLGPFAEMARRDHARIFGQRTKKQDTPKRPAVHGPRLESPSRH